MIQELKTFEYTCDFCRKTKIVLQLTHRIVVPDGWTLKEVGPCGVTDYYREDLMCPKCIKLEENKQ